MVGGMGLYVIIEENKKEKKTPSDFFETWNNKNCRREKRPALLTYIVAGDNNSNLTVKILKSISNYADVLELSTGD